MIQGDWSRLASGEESELCQSIFPAINILSMSPVDLLSYMLCLTALGTDCLALVIIAGALGH